MTDVTINDPTLSWGARVEVKPPPYVPFKYGLFSLIDAFQDFGSAQERSGVWTIPDPYANPADPTDGPDAFTYGDGCDTASDRNKDIPRGLLSMGADPITAYAGFACSPAGYTAAERERWARQALLLGEERALEEAIAGGSTTNVVTWAPPFDTGNSVNATSHVLLAQTFGNLDGKISREYGGEGSVLAPMSLWTYLVSFGLIKKDDDGNMRTSFGNRIAVCRGFGYQNLDASVPVYIAGALQIRRGDVKVLGDIANSVNFENNDVTRIVERTYVVSSNYPPAS